MAILGGFNYDPSKLSEQELNEYINFYRNDLARSHPSNIQGTQRTTNLLGRAEDELAKRRGIAETDRGRADLMALLGSGPAGSSFSEVDFMRGQDDIAQNQRKAIEDLYATLLPQQTDAINRVFNQQRSQALNEAAATGNLRQPNFLSTTIRDIDNQRGQSLSDAISNLGSQRFQQRLGVEQGLGSAQQRAREFSAGVSQQEKDRDQSRRMSLAGLLQGGGQFQQNFGLEQQRFGDQRRQSLFDNIMNINALEQAERVGRAQAQAQKPSFLDQFATVAGGVGGLLGGFGSLRKPQVNVYGGK